MKYNDLQTPDKKQFQFDILPEARLLIACFLPDIVEQKIIVSISMNYIAASQRSHLSKETKSGWKQL